MSVFYHKFEVRWSDIDANRHLANSSYVMYCSQTRMAFMNAHNIGVSKLVHWGVGPVIIHEEYFFYKEILANQIVYVSLETSGISKDASIYSFLHKFYLPDGKHCATCKVIGVWIDIMLRKMTTPPDEVLVSLLKYKTDQTEILTKENLKNLLNQQKNIDPSIFK